MYVFEEVIKKECEAFEVCIFKALEELSFYGCKFEDNT